MGVALDQFSVSGVDTILPFLRFSIRHPSFVAGRVSTHLVDDLVQEMASANAAVA
jgi:biotin carboxylase